MNRDEKIHRLKQASPVITQVTFTDDMGYEFSAVVSAGVIYPIPGMLLEYSGGEWPPNLWECKTEQEHHDRLRVFLLDPTWNVTPWSDISDYEIKECWEAIFPSNEEEAI